MNTKIQRFTHGPKQLVDRLNQMVDAINATNDFGDSTFITVKRLGNKVTPELNLNKVLERHPKLSGGGSITQLFAKVIEQPAYADPASFSLSGGRSYYTLRLVGTAENVYDDETTYADNSLVCYPTADDVMYKAKHPEGNTDPNVDHQPDLNTESPNDWWEKQDEIRVNRALGKEGTDETPVDIRLFTPWFEVGAIVPLITRTVVEETRYYIDFCLTYGGEHNEASIRWNQTYKRAMACFK